MKLSLNGVILGEALAFEDYLALAGRVGYDGVDFDMRACLQIARQRGVDEILTMFSRYDVQPANWGIPVDWKGPEDSYRETLDEFPRWVEMGAAIGCPRACTWIPPTVEGDAGDFREMAVRRWREIGQVAAEYDVRLGLEWVGPATSRTAGNEFIHTMDGLLEMEEEIGLENVALLVDSFHWYTAGHSVQDLASLSADRIVHVHINDAPDRPRDEQIDGERLLPGEGIIDLQAFLAALDSAGYDGFMGVETFSEKLTAMPAEKAAQMAADAARGVLEEFNR